MLELFVSKYLLVLDLRTNFQLSVIFLSSVLVSWNFRSVWTPPQDSVKINGCLFIKLSGCHCRSFIIHNKAHNKSCWGFIFYNWFIKIWKWVESSQKFIEKMVIEVFLIIFHIFKYFGLLSITFTAKEKIWEMGKDWYFWFCFQSAWWQKKNIRHLNMRYWIFKYSFIEPIHCAAC